MIRRMSCGDGPGCPEPVRVALIGAGNRSFTVYVPLFQDLTAWLKPTAVCDPIEEHAERAASRLGVPAYTDIRPLVRDRVAEAALVVTPIESHHAISVFLSHHGIHNIAETTWCSLVRQGQEMLEAARSHGVLAMVAEQLIRNCFLEPPCSRPAAPCGTPDF